MTVLSILTYPDPTLRKVSQPVYTLDSALKTLIQDMKQTMIACGHALGLSAIQVGQPWRIIIVDKGDGNLIEYINPVIIESQGKYSVSEGCLSLPGIEDGIQRAKVVTFTHYVFGIGFHVYDGPIPLCVTKTVSDLMAVVIQHEIDHLNGVLMYDHMSSVYKKRVDKLFKVKVE